MNIPHWFKRHPNRVYASYVHPQMMTVVLVCEQCDEALRYVDASWFERKFRGRPATRYRLKPFGDLDRA